MSVRSLAAALILATMASVRVEAAPWKRVSDLPEPRWFHAAAVGSDGHVYAFGGYVRGPGGQQEYGRGMFAIVDLDPGSQTWSRGPSLDAFEFLIETDKVVGRVDEQGRRHREVVKEDVLERGRVPVEVPPGRAEVGGRPHWLAFRTWVVFDPQSRTWTSPLKPRRRKAAGGKNPYRWQNAPAEVRVTPTTVSAPSDQIFITGGLWEGTDGGGMRGVATVERFDGRAQAWQSLSPMKNARYLHAAAIDRRGRIFVFGGSAAEPSTTQEEGESAESFRRRADENAAKANTSLSSVEMYDPETNSWSERAPLPTPRQAMGADLGADGRIYVVGGAPSYAHPRPLAVVEIYDPKTDTWETGPSMRFARRGHAVVATPDGKLYAIGGFVGPRERTLREQLAADFVDPALGATVEMLDTSKAR